MPETTTPLSSGISPKRATRLLSPLVEKTSHLMEESEISMPAAVGRRSRGVGNARASARENE
jgi:hypothetical protein